MSKIITFTNLWVVIDGHGHKLFQSCKGMLWILGLNIKNAVGLCIDFGTACMSFMVC